MVKRSRSVRSAPSNGDGWNRWRGEVDTRLDYLCVGQQEQGKSLNRVEEALHTLVSKSEEKQENIHEKLNTRVSALENFSTALKVKLAVITGVCSVLGGGVANMVFNYLFVKAFKG